MRFSNDIIFSGRFLKMPKDAQLLYFYILANSDDQGICEAYSIIKMIGSNEEHVKILESKSFLVILDEYLTISLTNGRNYNDMV